MHPQPQISVSIEEAEALARRLGLKWLSPQDMERLREAMATAAQAGVAVPRVSSKFDQPAPVFSVASQGSAG
jgi:hypothetical protein